MKKLVPCLLFNIAGLLRKILRVNTKYLNGFAYSDHESKKAIAFDEKFDTIKYKNKIVIDVGCGFGGSLLHILNQGAKACYGIEYDSVRTSAAVKFLVNECKHPDKFLILNADARTLPIQKKTVDIVVSDAVFEHIINLEKVINELFRVMKTGGKACFSCGSTWLTYNGGHLWTYIPIPWVHLLFRQKTIVNTLKLFYKMNDSNYPAKRIDNIINLYETLGYLTIRRLKRMLRKSSFKKYIVFQYSNRRWKKYIYKIPLLNDLFAGSVCCILEK